MNSKAPALAALSLAAVLALSGCNNKPTTIVAGDANDPQADQLKNAPPVAPPPMIQASRTYRCKDNSLVYADFYTNNTAAVRSAKEGTATTLTSPDGKAPYTAEGYSLSGNGTAVTYSAPGKGSQSCDTK